MTFFQNENISSVVVDRVACTFAKPTSDGKMGTHYTVVMFDKNKNVLYVGCECEHMHGEGVSALHEMSGANNTCFKVTAAFKSALNFTKGHQGKTIDRYSRNTPSLKGVSPFLSNALDTAFMNIIEVHNKRVPKTDGEIKYPLTGAYGEFMQTAVDRLTTNYLRLPTLQNTGRHAEKMQESLQHNALVRPRIFTVTERKFDYPLQFNDETGTPYQVPPSTCLVLSPTENTDVRLAVKPMGKPWLFDGDDIRYRAEYLYEGFSHNSAWKGIIRERKGFSSDRTYCVYCGRSFTRMPKHAKSDPHRDAVQNLVRLVCRATSSTGLRILNNPRHRNSTFNY
jgi:hypothetical protein